MRLRRARIALAALALWIAPLASPVSAKGHSSGHTTSHHTTSHHTTSHHTTTHKKSSTHTKSAGSHKTKRSKAARDAFMKKNPCPANGHTSGACPGYVVDHVVPLKRGGPDDPSNMQWQTIEEGKAKDKWE